MYYIDQKRRENGNKSYKRNMSIIMLLLLLLLTSCDSTSESVSGKKGAWIEATNFIQYEAEKYDESVKLIDYDTEYVKELEDNNYECVVYADYGESTSIWTVTVHFKHDGDWEVISYSLQ